jgi:hypothetical protein
LFTLSVNQREVLACIFSAWRADTNGGWASFSNATLLLAMFCLRSVGTVSLLSCVIVVDFVGTATAMGATSISIATVIVLILVFVVIVDNNGSI